MGSVGDAYDNAMAESFFASLECELLERTPGVRENDSAQARIQCVAQTVAEQVERQHQQKD